MEKQIICTFDKAQYLSGQQVVISLPEFAGPVNLRLYSLEKELGCDWKQKDNQVFINGLARGGYGIVITSQEGAWEGAFDVVADHREITRYGFLTDFATGETDDSDITWMRGLHINAVQYYDWMYRHDQLLPPTDRYRDPMGRETDLTVISNKIEKCREYGMRSFAYGAVYAATPDTFEKHPEWGMYTMEGKPMTFADWLYYMNVSKDNGWSEHILEEYRKVIAFGFSGIHMDTYGFPKYVWDSEGHPVNLAAALAELINSAASTVHHENYESGVIFNAVNNWPLEAVAATKQDSVYIEVWPPNDTYFDLYTLIREAKSCSQNRVILAAYLKPFMEADMQSAENAFRLTWAAISAAGGTQLVLGENRSILRDSYYVNYGHLRPEFLPIVQRYCDFLVRYNALLYNDKGTDISKTASGGINEDICFHSQDCDFSPEGRADRVWTIIRESSNKITINLINLYGNDACWNEPKQTPAAVSKSIVRLRLDRVVKGFYCASPDNDSLQAVELKYTFEDTGQGRIYTIEVSNLQFWTVVWAQLEE